MSEIIGKTLQIIEVTKCILTYNVIMYSIELFPFKLSKCQKDSIQLKSSVLTIMSDTEVV